LTRAFGIGWAGFGIVMHWVGLELLVSIKLDLALAVGVFCYYFNVLKGQSLTNQAFFFIALLKSSKNA
jgi:hypothetical protein